MESKIVSFVRAYMIAQLIPYNLSDLYSERRKRVRYQRMKGVRE